MEAFVTVVTEQDGEYARVKVLRFDDKDAAARFVKKLNGRSHALTEAQLRVALVEPAALTNDEAVASWIKDNTSGFEDA